MCEVSQSLPEDLAPQLCGDRLFVVAQGFEYLDTPAEMADWDCAKMSSSLELKVQEAETTLCID